MMPWFEGTHQETRSLPVTPEVAAAHFGDPAKVIAATKNVASADVDGATVHFVLEEEDHGVVKFTADYRCTYETDGTVVRWTAGEGNLKQSGTATFSPAEGGCTVDYSETIEVDLPVSSMLAPMLRPMMGPVLQKEVRAFLDRMVESL